MVTENERILVTGWVALKELNQHADPSGQPAASVASIAQECLQCARFFVTWLHQGGDPADLLYLRCAQAQQWHREVKAADEVVNEVLG